MAARPHKHNRKKKTQENKTVLIASLVLAAVVAIWAVAFNASFAKVSGNIFTFLRKKKIMSQEWGRWEPASLLRLASYKHLWLPCYFVSLI